MNMILSEILEKEKKEAATASSTQAASLSEMKHNVLKCLLNNDVDAASLALRPIGFCTWVMRLWHTEHPGLHNGWYLGHGPITGWGATYAQLTTEGDIIFFRPLYFGERVIEVKGNDNEAFFLILQLARRLGLIQY